MFRGLLGASWGLLGGSLAAPVADVGPPSHPKTRLFGASFRPSKSQFSQKSKTNQSESRCFAPLSSRLASGTPQGPQRANTLENSRLDSAPPGHAKGPGGPKKGPPEACRTLLFVCFVGLRDLYWARLVADLPPDGPGTRALTKIMKLCNRIWPRPARGTPPIRKSPPWKPKWPPSRPKFCSCGCRGLFWASLGPFWPDRPPHKTDRQTSKHKTRQTYNTDTQGRTEQDRTGQDRQTHTDGRLDRPTDRHTSRQTDKENEREG